MRNNKSSYEGLQKNIRNLKTPKIEVWRNQYPDKEYMVYLDTDELTCICPKTGLPDFAKVKIQYIPNRFCVELKSFKLYIYTYRNVGIFHEHLTNKILDDFVKACKPRFARIEIEMNIRGGINTTVSAIYKEKNG
ncbi:MAG: NADPH-dependent 7-cyano-7-deazaguanine reductase QueF [Candidatus Omnitrophica bacterium]|nr:NADPH-dependent 7-cyano-7-deazaguanine reductase QueF [Candidatus Omnitrophota bacterium]